MKIKLPKKTGSPERLELEATKIVVIGANGAGKTRFGVQIENEYAQNAHRISAQKLLSMPEQVNTTSIEIAVSNFLFGTQSGQVAHREGHRWGGRPNTGLLNDFEKLMVLLHTEEYDQSVAFKDKYVPQQAIEKPVTKLDKIQHIWELVLPHRTLVKRAGMIEVYPAGVPQSKYNAAEMSDGERVTFYLIGEVLSVPQNTIIIIDEPEMHLHKSINKPLWDILEYERQDCVFIYLTHDVEFVATRQNARTIWIKSYNGDNQWDYEVLDQSTPLPERIFLEILGSRKPVLFFEGVFSNIDYMLFEQIYPEYFLQPLGSCSKVIDATKSFNDLEAFHQIKSFGLIDRDRRTDEDIAHIGTPNVWVAEVAEVENFLLLEDVVRLVASSMGKDPSEVFQHVKDNVFTFFQSQLEVQAVQHTLSRIDRIFRTTVSFRTIKTYAELDSSFQSFWAGQNFGAIFTEVKTLFEKLLTNNDYDGVLKVFNNKGLIPESGVSVLCGLNPKNNEYFNFIINILRSNSEGNTIIRRAIDGKVTK